MSLNQLGVLPYHPLCFLSPAGFLLTQGNNMKYNTINWKVIAGETRLSWIQRYDLILDQKDLDLRFPPRNIRLLKAAGL